MGNVALVVLKKVREPVMVSEASGCVNKRQAGAGQIRGVSLGEGDKCAYSGPCHQGPLPSVLGCDDHPLPCALLVTDKQKSGRAGIGVCGAAERASPTGQDLPASQSGLLCRAGQPGRREQLACKEEAAAGTLSPWSWRWGPSLGP